LHLDLGERRGCELDCGVERERRELLALRLLHALGLLLGELTQAAHEVVGVAAERETKAAAAFHTSRLAVPCTCARPPPRAPRPPAAPAASPTRKETRHRPRA